MLVISVEHKSYVPGVAILISLGFTLALFYFMRRRIFRLYLQPNPYVIADFYRKSMRRAPNGTAMAAYCSALAFTLYGQYESARAELAPVDWFSLPPLYQGFERCSLSLIALFEVRDYEQALALSEQGRELCAVSELFPGSKQAKVFFDTNIAVNKLLMGEATPNLLEQLEKSVAQLQNIWRAFPAWALAVHYGRIGNLEKAESYKVIVRTLVPHCKPLNDFN